MKRLSLLIIITFIIMITSAKADVSLSFSKESSKYWQYISDRTMGGVSNGQALLEQEEDFFFARLTGNVSTKNNGGFIQLRSNLPFDVFEKTSKTIKGVRMRVRGNGETYHIFIRTKETQSYSDFYLAPFETKSEWAIIDLPFNKFTHRFSSSLTLDGKSISTFAIVAYGRNFISDVSVSAINFYY